MTYISIYETTKGFSTDNLIKNLALAAREISNVAFKDNGTALLTIKVNGKAIGVEFSLDYYDDNYGSVENNNSDFDRITFYNESGENILSMNIDKMTLNDFKGNSTTSKIKELLFSEDDGIAGNDGDDVLRSYDGDDSMSGYGGNDFLGGGEGADTLWGDAGDDALAGGADDDILYGGSGKDLLNGGSGNDALYGGSGSDILKGGSGKDWLDGGSGKDTLEGGKGADTLLGGSGADLFVFKSAKDSTVKEAGRDMIQDFSETSGDRIDLKAIDANTKSAGNQAFKFIGDDGFHKTAGELRYKQYDNGETYVYGDVNGDGKADFAIGFSGLIDFTKADFIL